MFLQVMKDKYCERHGHSYSAPKPVSSFLIPTPHNFPYSHGTVYGSTCHHCGKVVFDYHSGQQGTPAKEQLNH